MNKNKLKSYAPAARRVFIQAVTDRAHFWGLSEKGFDQIEQKGDIAIIGGRPFPLKVAGQRKKLEEKIKRDGFNQVMEAIAYTWFDRFMALRFMEIQDYLEHGLRVLSNRNGSHIPEILEQAAKIDLPGLDKQKLIELKLDGNKDMELYRMLLVAQCNALNDAMPFLFERIDDETELLLPDNLLHSDSLIRSLVTEIDEDDWQEVEIIGWLYQFYISEKKDQVIGKVVKSEDIPAATQLFTPNWIVKYMIQNSLGRMWLATYPDSSLRQKMEYYIEPAEQNEEVQAQLRALTPESIDPEMIKLLDPAMGSGHILVEKYDILKEIYLERGYRSQEIPRLILEKNLYGLDIDDRAAQMAGFALLMRARMDDKTILQGKNPPKLHVMAIQESSGINSEMIANTLLKEKVYRVAGDEDLFPDERQQPFLFVKKSPDVRKEDIVNLLDLFNHGKTFGSLITIPEEISEKLPTLKNLVNTSLADGDMFVRQAASILSSFVEQTIVLAKKYDCVVANPPYMGGRWMNTDIKLFARAHFPDSKADLFAMFAEHLPSLTKKNGYLGLVTPFVWMSISSYEKLRNYFFKQKTITSLVKPSYTSFFDSAIVPLVTFIVQQGIEDFKGNYFDLGYLGSAESQPVLFREAIGNSDSNLRYFGSAKKFKKIPGSPIAFWISDDALDVYESCKKLSEIASPSNGVQTGDNGKYVRYWFEISVEKIGSKWFGYNKGGPFRRWYGNILHVVDWENSGSRIKSEVNSCIRGEEFYFSEGLTWSDVTSSMISCRYLPPNNIFDAAGPSAFFSSRDDLLATIALMNTKFISNFVKILNPTMHFQSGDFRKLPAKFPDYIKNVVDLSGKAIEISRLDWIRNEESQQFLVNGLVKFRNDANSISVSWSFNKSLLDKNIFHLIQIEEEINRIFIEAYGLQDELTPDVPEDQITLARADRTADMKRLISYAIGCMMGRYSLDQPGLVYAHSGNVGFDPSKYKTFHADDDGIIPILDMDWFSKDAAIRFEEFLKVTWSPEALEENLKFIAESLSPKSGEMPRETIRRYLSTQFFKDHLQMYKKRPIYWLFSSGKQRAFECLVYLHRYNEATLSRMRNEYVTPLQGKLTARIEYLKSEIDATTTTSARNKLQKQLDILKKKQTELSAFDDLLRHYADQRITIDLDEGVKVNYGKFGNLLTEVKAVTGSSE